MLTLPTIPYTFAAIDWNGLPRRFMNAGELECLIALLRSVTPRVVVEFGCNEGRTAAAILRNVRSVTQYVGVDVPHGYVTEKLVQRNEVPLRPGHLALGDERFSILLPKGGSQSLIAADLPPVVDAVFIDGDHGYRGVMHDTMLAKAVVREGGLILWHDYHDLGTVDVREALHDLAGSGQTIWNVKGTWIALQRVGIDDRQAAAKWLQREEERPEVALTGSLF
jgi:predicted O-methyltransferase YrrM